MTFSLRRKHPTTPRRGRRTPTAATISLIATLVLGGAASAQSIVPEPEWHPVGQTKPQVLPSSVQSVQPVQFKPAGAPQQFPAAKVAQPVQEPGRIVVPAGMKIRAAEDDAEFSVRTDPPGVDRLTMRLSEAQFFESIRQEARRRQSLQRIYFPEEEPISRQPHSGRQSAYHVKLVEPTYVMHGRLFFEQKNLERHGWDIGPLSPVVETGVYYYDLVMLPYHLGTQARRAWDTSAGKGLPGDATPLVIYREQFSITGIVFEAGAVVGLGFAFP